MPISKTAAPLAYLLQEESSNFAIPLALSPDDEDITEDHNISVYMTRRGIYKVDSRNRSVCDPCLGTVQDVTTIDFRRSCLHRCWVRAVIWLSKTKTTDDLPLGCKSSSTSAWARDRTRIGLGSHLVSEYTSPSAPSSRTRL